MTRPLIVQDGRPRRLPTGTPLETQPLRFRLTRSTAQAIDPGAETRILWDSAPIQVGSWWSAATPSVFTIPQAGDYLIGFSLQMGTTSGAYAALQRNSDNLTYLLEPGISYSTQSNFNASILLPFSQGDQLMIRLRHDTGGARNLQTSPSLPTVWGIQQF